MIPSCCFAVDGSWIWLDGIIDAVGAVIWLLATFSTWASVRRSEAALCAEHRFACLAKFSQGILLPPS